MVNVIEVITHALYVRDTPNGNISSSLGQGEQAMLDGQFAVNAWLHIISPHIGYIYSAPNYVRLLDISVTPPAGDVDRWQVNTDVLNIRKGPGTNWDIVAQNKRGVVITAYRNSLIVAEGHRWLQIASQVPQWFASDLCVQVTSSPPPPLPMPQPVPIPPIGSWSPPLNPALYGGHGNPGGYSPGDPELDAFRRNRLNYVLIAGYQQNQQGAISRYRSAGVQYFVIRATVNGGASAADFARITLPILEQYAQALGRTAGMMIVLGNEPNLVEEGWTKYWQGGRDFAVWWLTVASVYRANLSMCRIGFAPMSPGGNVGGVRMDERDFVAGCNAAIISADFVAVHNYWSKPDASDLAVPLQMWRSQFGSKPLIVTESGPVMDGPTVTVQALQHAHAIYGAANIPCTFFIVDSSGDPRFSNAGWLQQGIQL